MLQVLSITILCIMKMCYLIMFRPFVDPIMQTTEEVSSLCEAGHSA